MAAAGAARAPHLLRSGVGVASGSLERELGEARREAEAQRARAEELQDRVWELQGLLKQSQENHDALVRPFARICAHLAAVDARAERRQLRRD